MPPLCVVGQGEQQPAWWTLWHETAQSQLAPALACAWTCHWGRVIKARARSVRSATLKRDAIVGSAKHTFLLAIF